MPGVEVNDCQRCFGGDAGEMTKKLARGPLHNDSTCANCVGLSDNDVIRLTFNLRSVPMHVLILEVRDRLW